MDIISYALSKKYTDETAAEFGGLKGAPCTIKSIVKQNGQNIITFEWKNSEGETRESVMYVNDGTPIYVWESGDHYNYGDLVIYTSAFYRCIIENSDADFDDTKWNEIGSPDGNYDIVQDPSLLPARFTSADRKLYYSISDSVFYLWNGNAWVAQSNVRQYTIMPTASATFVNSIVQFIGQTGTYTKGYFYECVEEDNEYLWQQINVVNMDNKVKQIPDSDIPTGYRRVLLSKSDNDTEETGEVYKASGLIFNSRSSGLRIINSDGQNDVRISKGKQGPGNDFFIDLILGNPTPSGTNGARYGRLEMYGTGTGYVAINAKNVTGIKTIEIPNNSGTLALLSDTGQNYSPLEEEIGTWIDGNKLYQKTFPYHFSQSMVNWEVFDDRRTYDILIDVEVLSIIDMGGAFNHSTGYRPKSNDENELPRFCVTQGKLYAYAEGTYEGYVTVKYTKTEDTQQSESANFQESIIVEEV